MHISQKINKKLFSELKCKISLNEETNVIVKINCGDYNDE